MNYVTNIIIIKIKVDNRGKYIVIIFLVLIFNDFKQFKSQWEMNDLYKYIQIAKQVLIFIYYYQLNFCIYFACTLRRIYYKIIIVGNIATNKYIEIILLYCSIAIIQEYCPKS